MPGRKKRPGSPTLKNPRRKGRKPSGEETYDRRVKVFDDQLGNDIPEGYETHKEHPVNRMLSTLESLIRTRRLPRRPVKKVSGKGRQVAAATRIELELFTIFNKSNPVPISRIKGYRTRGKRLQFTQDGLGGARSIHVVLVTIPPSPQKGSKTPARYYLEFDLGKGPVAYKIDGMTHSRLRTLTVIHH